MDEMAQYQNRIRELNKQFELTDKKQIYIRDFDFDKWPFGYWELIEDRTPDTSETLTLSA